jgi:hypothetical protein
MNTDEKANHVFEIRPHPWGWYIRLNGDNIARFKSLSAAQDALLQFKQKAEDYQRRINELGRGE